MAKPIVFNNLTAYKKSTMNDYDKFIGNYTVEVEPNGEKARIKCDQAFMKGKSRLNKLNPFAHIDNDVHCYMTVNGLTVFFVLPNLYDLINL